MSCSKRPTSGDLSSAKLSSVLANDIPLISRGTHAWQPLADAHARSCECGTDLAPRKEQTGKPENKNAGTDCSGVFQRNCSVLEGKRDAAAHDTEVIFRPIHHVPTEIVQPADVRGDANFDAAAELADCLCRRIGLLS